MNLLERLKMILWRIGVNFLPTKENLLNRFHVSDAYCLFCKDSNPQATFSSTALHPDHFGSLIVRALEQRI